MTPAETLAPALNAPARARPVGQVLEGRRRRVVAIRKRVVATSVALFLALWLAIFAQLVTGHDPALSRSKASASTSASSSGSTSAATSSTSGSTGSSGSSGSTSSSGTVSSVTTSQS